MFLAHLWATGHAAPPELGFIRPRCSTNMSSLRGWGAFAPGVGAKPSMPLK